MSCPQPWLRQLLVKGTGEVQRVEERDCVIRSIAAMCEPTLEGVIYLYPQYRGSTITLPLTYLTHLWPQAYRFEVEVPARISLAHNHPADVLVVLSGVQF